MKDCKITKLPRLKLDTKFKTWVHKILPTASSRLWAATHIRIYDRILRWLYPS